jgi:hypothetical protein
MSAIQILYGPIFRSMDIWQTASGSDEYFAKGG